jgi:hypothetical protein
VTILKVPTVGKKVVVAGTDYVYGTTFALGNNAVECAKNLAAAVNADICRTDLHNQTQPIKAVFALWYGNVVRIVATCPGTAGNLLTLSTDEAASFAVSDATLSGGTAVGITLAS